jgi:hypothetical protein
LLNQLRVRDALFDERAGESCPVEQARLQFVQVAGNIVIQPEVGQRELADRQRAQFREARLPRFDVQLRRRGRRAHIGCTWHAHARDIACE